MASNDVIGEAGTAGEGHAGPFRLAPPLAVPLLILAGLGGALLLERLGQGPLAPMAFLLAVLVAAAVFGTTAGIATALASFLVFNFFFIPPTWTFQVAGWPEFFALGVYLLIAVTTGGLAGRLRERAEAARLHAEAIAKLYDSAGALAAAETTADVAAILGRELAALLGTASVVLEMKDDHPVQVWPAAPVALSAADLQAAQFASRRGAIGGAPADAEAGRFEFRPWGDRAAARVVGIAVPDGRLSPQREQAFEALLRQAGIAAERTRLAEATREARLEAERERLRAAVLSSLSHDLRTPLASILGSVTSLRRFGASMPQADSDDLLAAIEEETQRLARYVGNLLDLTRIQAGALQTARDWIDPADAARAAVDRARRAYPETVFTLACEPSTPLVRGDAVLLEQAIFNLLDNAARFAGADGPVTVQVEPVEGCVRIAVSDAGPGIPARDLPHVFESFYRGGEAGAVAGSGLGLAVSRGMVLALGGEIEALSPLLGGRGTRMLIHLPLPGDHGGDRP